MKEELYALSVTDGFNADCECPLCAMYKTLENDAIDYTLGPSYMEDDIREVTDKIGFCSYHLPKLYKNQNRLGLALMLKTHMDKTIKDVEKMNTKPVKSKGGLLKKSPENTSPLSTYFNTLNSSCFVCDKINNTFNRYVDTVIYLYKKDSSFKEKFLNCKGFCNTHYEALYTAACQKLSGDLLNEFVNNLNTLYIENLKRVRDDLDWFICKFDYRYANEPWKNSKDALIRTCLKTNSVDVDS